MRPQNLIENPFIPFSFNGMEKDNEVKGGGNSYTTFYRMLDPRLGRWFSLDPVFQQHQSPYNSMDNSPIRLNDQLGNYTKKQVERKAEKAKANGFDAAYKLSDRGGKRDWILSVMKENDDKSGMYIRQMQTGNFKGFREKDFESYYDDEYEYFLGKNKSTYNKSNVKLEYNYVSAFEYSIPMARETYDEVVPDAVGITVGTNAHAGFGGSTNVGFVFFTKGADFGFHGIHTKSAGAGFSAGVGFNIFAGYYNGDAKNMKSDFGGIGYQAGGKVLLGGTVWGAQKENGNLGWGGGSFGIGLSGGSSAEVTKTKYLGEK